MDWSAPDFDYRTEVSRFEGLTAVFQNRYQGLCRIQAGTEIQDAFFHSAIHVPAEASSSRVKLWVLVSNFGTMANYGVESYAEFHSDRVVEGSTTREERAFIEQTLAELGYRVISSDALNEPYNGLRGEIQPATWFFRYFHYV